MKTHHFGQSGLMSLLALMFAFSVSAQQGKLPVTQGPYKPTDVSLQQYQYPDWFRDAKLGSTTSW
jgi:alpha-L-fucosidase